MQKEYLRTKVRRLLAKIILVYALIFLFALAFAFVSNNAEKSRISNLLASVVKNSLINGDYRTTMISLTQSIPSQFEQITYIDTNNLPIFSIPVTQTTHSWHSIFYSKIDIVFDNSSRLVFSYSRLSAVAIAMLFWMLIGFLGLPISRKLYLGIINDYEENIEREKYIQINILASQVSHDIRSPLAALEMISGSLNELPEDKRLIIRNSINRIRDISNSLLDKNRALKTTDQTSPQTDITKPTHVEEFSTTLLSPLIDSIITEKRIQYRNHIGIRIEFNQTKESYGLFAKIQPHEFQRVLSNLIDNSVEAFIHQQGIVELILHANQSNGIELLIQDNGKGIPEGTLAKLGTRGETYGKEKGSGLGLFHAKETMQLFHGSLKIESKENLGTTVTLTLPLENAPTWFIPKISLKANQTIIVFDDDQSIHQIWKGRIESLANNSGITIRNFSEPNELRKFYGKNFTDLDDALFLMDYEISGTSESGLDVIEALGIQKQSILVTSRYEEKNIRDRCESLGIRLIPKTMSGFVPMEIV